MSGRVIALSGGVGGAKLVHGLYRRVRPEDLMVIGNTGDDFTHLGLSISPDLDTLVYTLGGVADPVRGWGRRDETWTFMTALEALGGETWFRLGDADLALHVERTRRLRAGETLTEVTHALAGRLGVTCKVLPMSDDPVQTRLRTGDGWLAFQDYFVRRQCAPKVIEIAYDGAASARALREFIEALSDTGLRAVVICPSNPFLSIEPILAVPGVREALEVCPAPVIAVSPIIAGKAVKGPTAKLMAELGLTVDNETIARRYAGLIDALIIDQGDAASCAVTDIEVIATPTLMQSDADRERLADMVLETADRISARPSRPLSRRRIG